MHDEIQGVELFNIDAEQAILGALMYYEVSLYEQISDRITAEHFFDPVHQRIAEKIFDRLSRGQKSDPVALKVSLEKDDGLQSIGGVSYLAALQDAAADEFSASAYADIVRDLFTRRELKRASQSISMLAEEDLDSDPGEAIEKAERLLTDVSEGLTSDIDFGDMADDIEAAWEQAELAAETGEVVGINTGLKDLDRILDSLCPSDLIYLGGRPSMGKTVLGVEIATRIALMDKKVGIVSLEMSRQQLAQRMAVSTAGRMNAMLSVRDMRTGEFYSDADKINAREASRALGEKIRGNCKVCDKGNITLAEISRVVRAMKRKMGGLDFLLIDYLGLIKEDGRRRDGNRTNAVSDISSGLKALAKMLGVPIMVLSQLSRQVEQRPDKRPMLSDLRDSGSVEQDADVVMFVYREAYYKEREQPAKNSPEYDAWNAEFQAIRDVMEVIIAKQRQGSIGTARVKFHDNTLRVEDFA